MAVSVISLQKAAKAYDKAFRALPFIAVKEILDTYGFDARMIKHGDATYYTRKVNSGLMSPYKSGLTMNQTKALTEYLEATLDPKRVYSEITDNLTNYDQEDVELFGGNVSSNTHPLEYEVIRALIEVWNRDLAFALLHAERDEAGTGPVNSFDGILTRLATLKASGLIATSNGNLKTTGAIAAPATDAMGLPLETLVGFLASANGLMRRQDLTLAISESTLNHVKTSYADKVKMFAANVTDAMVLEYVKEKARISSLKFAINPLYGTGSQLILTTPKTFMFGVKDQIEKSFVTVRNPYADPNEVQFFMQDAYDTAIRCVDKTQFLTNDQVQTAPGEW